MFIRPAVIPDGMEGAGTRYRVRDPVTRDNLMDQGEEKPADDYWLRRLVEGGVEEVAPPAPAIKPQSEEAAKLPEHDLGPEDHTL